MTEFTTQFAWGLGFCFVGDVMPTKPPTPCSQPGCPARAVSHGRCAQHQRPRISQPRGTTTEQGYGWQWQQIRTAVLTDEPWCRECARRGLMVQATVVDHIVPLRQGGGYERSNLQPLCGPCHNRKRASEDKRWRKQAMG